MATLTCYCSCPSKSLLYKFPKPQLFTKNPFTLSISRNPKWIYSGSITLQCSNFNLPNSVTLQESDFETETDNETETEDESEGEEGVDGVRLNSLAPMKKKRKRYRKQYPGEKKGITEEMRFVAMKLRNVKGKKKSQSSVDDMKDSDDVMKDSDDEMKDSDDGGDGYESVSSEEEDDDDDDNGDVERKTWQPSIEGFIKYLVDSKLVFDTVERIVDESSDVSYVYFRKTGLERAECISKDLEWFSQQGHVIPEPSTHGVTYANYLEEVAEKTAPLFLCHFYNIYFSHIAGGQVIAKKAFGKLVKEKELEFVKWKGDEEELLRGMREKLNMLAKHWSRYDKNRCLREVTKAFRFLGQIVRQIIL